MHAAHAAQALAQASSALTKPHDVAGALTDLMANCRFGLNVDAVGILVASSGRLELLASSSHDASELEVHQLHTDEGPCIDAYRGGKTIQLHTAEKLLQRWPTFAPTMVGAGFGSVHATPLTWQGKTFGAMGLFRHSDEEFRPEEDAVARAFADIATVLVVHLEEVDSQQLEGRISEALGARIVVEQAKGVLADQRGISMAEAYEALVDDARTREHPLTGTERLSHLERHVVLRRARLMTHLIGSACADLEARAKREGGSVDWVEAGDFLCDAVAGMLQAPVTTRSSDV